MLKHVNIIVNGLIEMVKIASFHHDLIKSQPEELLLISLVNLILGSDGEDKFFVNISFLDIANNILT